MPAAVLASGRYRCGNDMICSWAGSLACRDGVSVIAGTGSMAYGEYAGRCARAGGWGELIGDEGSAYWLAREGMNLFSRMSDGRAARGPLYELVRARLGLDSDLDLCARVYGEREYARGLAQLRRWSAAAQAGDGQANDICARCRRARGHRGRGRQALTVPGDTVLPVLFGWCVQRIRAAARSFRDALADAALPFSAGRRCCR
jgi:N-acetylglucosamine kinase-like BadF-type ATPase